VACGRSYAQIHTDVHAEWAAGCNNLPVGVVSKTRILHATKYWKRKSAPVERVDDREVLRKGLANASFDLSASVPSLSVSLSLPDTHTHTYAHTR
jgi:hypothetical protein